MERNTQQRKAIIEVFKKADRPLSVPEVRERAKRWCKGIGIATVYRNLKNLVEDGLISSLEMPGGIVLYEKSTDVHHHHFACLNCQKVFDIEACNLDFERLVPAGFELENHEVLLSGRCQVCAARS